MSYHRKFLLFENDCMCRRWGKEMEIYFLYTAFPEYFRVSGKDGDEITSA